nr:FAD:protein FMN transferase [Salinimonas marina]
MSTVVLVLAACGNEKLPVVHLHGDTMGTTYNVKYVVSDQQQAVEGLQSKIDTRLQRINALMSTYDPESELSRFNQNRFTKPFVVSAETRTVVTEALRLSQVSKGALDVTVGPLVNLWGFGPNKRPEQVPSDEQIAQVRDYVGAQKLRVTDEGLQKTHPQVYVDLSTIAKGYGVDEIAQILEKHDIHDYLVEIGGEMRVKGQRGDGSGWLIAIEKPVSSERAVQKILSVGTNAIATSGDYRNYYEQDGVRYSHLIDPRTGKPITHNLVAVTVVDPSSMTADGLATALNVMGWDAAKALAEEQNLAVLLIRHHNGEFEEYLSAAFEETVEIKN